MASALRVTGNTMVDVDNIVGCAIQMETVLRFPARNSKILFVDKVDHCILESRME